jgi:hypothetical protein
MEIKRKLQFGASAVIANAALALGIMSPIPAQANPCSPIVRCNVYLCGGAGGGLAGCQAVALPGCTATSMTCSMINLCTLGPGFTTVCRYD